MATRLYPVNVSEDDNIHPEDRIVYVGSNHVVRNPDGSMRVIPPRQMTVRQIRNLVDAHELHEQATNLARELFTHRFKTMSNLSLDSWVGDTFYPEHNWDNVRYSPYHGDGIPHRHRVKLESAIDKVRVKVFRKDPLNLFEIKQKALLRDLISSRFWYNHDDLGTSLKFRFHAMRANRWERHALIMKLIYPAVRHTRKLDQYLMTNEAQALEWGHGSYHN